MPTHVTVHCSRYVSSDKVTFTGYENRKQGVLVTKVSTSSYLQSSLRLDKGILSVKMSNEWVNKQRKENANCDAKDIGSL